MAATFASTILGQPEIASMVFEFQFGSYEDVRPAFRACHELVELGASRHRVYMCDPFFRQAFAPNATWSDGHLKYIAPTKYALCGDQLDPRLPLHLAVAEGFAQLTKRILGCRPDLASQVLIFLAFWTDHLEIAELLLHARETMPELSFRDIRQNNSARCTAYHKSLQYAVAKTLARDDSRGLLLLQRFGPRPDDLKNYERRLAIQEATLANLTLALDLFPWLFYPSLMDDIAGRGFLPLVRLLHERGVDCSTDAMDKVAANGHLEVVCFLHLYRREGCTSYAMDIAAGNGHLDVVTFLHVNRSEGCTVDALDRAISNGQLDVVRFLLEHRFEGASLNVLDDAAVNGHFGVVQYLHSLGSFGCTVGAVDGAARCGHLEIVTFLLTHRSEGCTLDNVVDIAMAHGQLQTAEYLLSLGCPFPTSMSRCDEDAFRKPEMVGVMQLLIARGYSMESKWLFKACEVNNVPLVRFLCSHLGTASRRKALHTAMWAMAWDVVRYLLATDTKEVSARTQLKQALCSGNFEAAAHILQDQPGLSSASRLKGCLNLEATRYLLSAGDFRECLVTLAGRQQHVTASKSLLPYCMHAIDHLDNVSFLLDLLALPNRRRATILQLITPELLDQGKKASESTQLASCAAARASAQLEAGEVVDWALALVIGHLHVTNATPTIEQLEKKISLVQDGQLQMQLTRQQTQASR